MPQPNLPAVQPFPFPDAGVPFIDANGANSEIWVRFLLSLQNRTGGQSGVTPVVNVTNDISSLVQIGDGDSGFSDGGSLDQSSLLALLLGDAGGDSAGSLAFIPAGDLLANISGGSLGDGFGDLILDGTGNQISVGAGSGPPVGVSLTALLDYIFGAIQGTLFFRSAAAWVSLLPGPFGTVLTSGGLGADLFWGVPGGVLSLASGGFILVDGPSGNYISNGQ